MSGPRPGTDGRFLTTHWSLVAAAGMDAPHSRESLARLCETYWSPVYAYMRRRGMSGDEARDLTQAFFLSFLANNSVHSADPRRGRFRSFLLASVRHFLCNEWDRRSTLKRGGGATVMPLDLDTADRRIHCEPVTDVTPERLFEHRWALALFERALQELGDEQQRLGNGNVFACLRPYLTPGCAGDDYSEPARTLASTPGAVRVAVHRLRRRLRAILVEHVSQTVADPAEIDAELQYLGNALRAPEEGERGVAYVP